MLTSKFQTNDVITLKLVSGEEIIGYYQEESSVNIILRKPVVPVPTANGTMALAPFIMSSDYLQTGGAGEISFNKQTVITKIKTSPAFSDAYIKQVSGLDLSIGTSSKLITT